MASEGVDNANDTWGAASSLVVMVTEGDTPTLFEASYALARKTCVVAVCN